MAPELLAAICRVENGRRNIPPPKEPVDIYAFGMVIYEVISRFPHSSGTSSIL